MDPIKEFNEEVKENIKRQGSDTKLQQRTTDYLCNIDGKYTYNFSWMGRPIIQFPQDMVAMQELIWKLKPDLIIETGIAHGGSLIMYASFMEMMGLAGGHILGIDIDIRQHNRAAIENHPMFKRITMFEGSSIADNMHTKVKEFAKNYNTIMVVLDSNHTEEHVLKELELYSPLVTAESYCVVFDTLIEDMQEGSFPDRPWDKGDNPKTAVWKFLANNPSFEIDKTIQDKLLLTAAPDGYLKRLK